MSLRRVLCDIPNWAGASSGGNQLSFRPRYVRKFLSDLMAADIETVRTIVVDDMRAAIGDVLTANGIQPPHPSR